MRRSPARVLIASAVALGCALPVAAGVRMTQTTVFHGYGSNNVGRSTATTTTLVHGVRSRSETTMEFEGKLLRRLTGKQIDVSITDVAEQWIRTLDPKKETYTELSFADFIAQRDQLTDQLAALRGQAPPEAEDDDAPKMEFDPPEVSVTPAGKATLAGFDASLLDVLVKMVGRYPDSEATCEIHLDGRLGFGKTPGADELRAYHEKLAEGLGLTRAQMQGVGQSALSAMGRYGEGFEKLFEEIKKQEGTLLRQHLKVKVKGACGGPGGAAASGDLAGGEEQPERPGQAVKQVFKKFKFGRKKKDREPEPEPEAETTPPGESDEFVMMLAIDTDTESFEVVPDPGPEPFTVPAGFKKVEPRMPPAEQ